MRTYLWIAAILALAAAGPAGAAERSEHYKIGFRQMQAPRAQGDPLLVSVWYPTDDTTGGLSYPLPGRPLQSDATREPAPAVGPFPLVIYSHGAGGCAIMGATYAEALVENGFVVAGPDHGDEFVVTRSDGSVTADAARVRQWVEWARTGSRARFDRRPSFQFTHRPPEIRLTIDHLLAQSADPKSPLSGLIDADRIGIMGVSFGAWTTQAVAGYHEIYRDPRIKAAVPIAGNALPSIGSFANVHVPVMLIFGQKETIALLDKTTPLKTDGMVRDYESANAPRYLVGIADTDHLDFGPTGKVIGQPLRAPRTAREIRESDAVVVSVNRYCVAFFRRYLKDDAAADEVLRTQAEHIFLFKADPGKQQGGAGRAGRAIDQP